MSSRWEITCRYMKKLIDAIKNNQGVAFDQSQFIHVLLNIPSSISGISINDIENWLNTYKSDIVKTQQFANLVTLAIFERCKTDRDKVWILNYFENKLTSDEKACVMNLMPTSVVASKLNEYPVDKAASILNSTCLSIDKAASILNSTNITVSRCADILGSNNITDDRVDSILSNTILTLQKVLDIINEMINKDFHSRVEYLLNNVDKRSTFNRVFMNYFGFVKEGTGYRLIESSVNRVSTIGSPSITDTTLDSHKAIRLKVSSSCECEGIGLSNYAHTDIEIFWDVYGVKGEVAARMQDITTWNNTYLFDFDTPYSTGDFAIIKHSAGSVTTLARESIDLSSTTRYVLKAELVGSTLRFYRNGELKLEATDTEFTSGGLGIGRHDVDLTWANFFSKPYGSATEFIKPKSFWLIDFRVEYEGKYPIYTPNVPHNPRKNILATWGSLSPRLDYGECIVAIFNATDKAIEELSIKAKKLSIDEIFRIAKKYDDKLWDGDIKHFVNPNIETELEMLADFYEREVLTLSNVKLDKAKERQIMRYVNKAKKINRDDLVKRFNKVLKK